MNNTTKDLLKKIQPIFKDKNYKSVIEEIDSFFQRTSYSQTSSISRPQPLGKKENMMRQTRLYTEGLRLDPNNTHLLNNLAKLLILQKEHNSANP